MSEIINFVKANAVDFLAIYGGIVIIASTIVKLTPTKKDDEVLGKIMKLINFFSTVTRK